MLKFKTFNFQINGHHQTVNLIVTEVPCGWLAIDESIPQDVGQRHNIYNLFVGWPPNFSYF